MQQREGLFHHPPVSAQAGAVSGAAPGDQRADLQLPDKAAVLVVAAVGQDGIGASAGAAAFAADLGMASSSGRSWVTSSRLPPVRITASGMPVASVIRRCLLPARPRSTGDGPVCGSL
ncbi:hypothetical protein Aph01nite_28810 [Acrocarpospora phusangensis]|uniref:Uncharacterized protein n=1 Tax=Acrocarpospora phusangensis TaxID=1070424 RepID=A0A919UK40_9ACTN|nr:hypothetical protein Aph01nite_28810 [Acrocarpospora phusangensis]